MPRPPVGLAPSVGGRAAFPGHLLGHFLKGLFPGDAGTPGCAPLPRIRLQGVRRAEGEASQENESLEAA